MGEGVPKNLVDGAVCLRRHLRGLPLTAVGLDFYHLSAIEAMCKATTRRIKGPGMRWDIDHAEATKALECMYQSNLWDQYWTKAAEN
jgi:hypothetical protein